MQDVGAVQAGFFEVKPRDTETPPASNKTAASPLPADLQQHMPRQWVFINHKTSERYSIEIFRGNTGGTCDCGHTDCFHLKSVLKAARDGARRLSRDSRSIRRFRSSVEREKEG